MAAWGPPRPIPPMGSDANEREQPVVPRACRTPVTVCLVLGGGGSTPVTITLHWLPDDAGISLLLRPTA